MRRPLPTEYTSYHATYIENQPYSDVGLKLAQQVGEFEHALGSLSESAALARYAPEKWSVKEVLGHVIDTERIFSARCLAVARGETQALPGFDEEVYVAAAGFDRRPLSSLLDELRIVRAATLSLFGSLTEKDWQRRGIANDKLLAARAVPWLVAGHASHHLQVLRKFYL